MAILPAGSTTSDPNQIFRDAEHQGTCIQVSVFAVGLILALAATALYVYQVSAITAYCLWGVGGAVMIADVILSVRCCLENREAELENLTYETKKAAFELEQNHNKILCDQARLGESQAIMSQSITLRDYQKQLALIQAANAGQAEVVRMLLVDRVNPLIRYQDVHKACFELHERTLDSELFSRSLVQIPAVYLPAFNATAGSVDTLKAFLNFDGTLRDEKMNHPRQFNLLNTAVYKRATDPNEAQYQLDIIRFLLGMHVKPNEKNIDGDTPLHRAVSCPLEASIKPSMAVIEALVRGEADWDITNNNGLTPRQSMLQNPHLAKWREDNKDALTALGVI